MAGGDVEQPGPLVGRRRPVGRLDVAAQPVAVVDGEGDAIDRRRAVPLHVDGRQIVRHHRARVRIDEREAARSRGLPPSKPPTTPRRQRRIDDVVRGRPDCCRRRCRPRHSPLPPVPPEPPPPPWRVEFEHAAAPIANATTSAFRMRCRCFQPTGRATTISASLTRVSRLTGQSVQGQHGSSQSSGKSSQSKLTMPPQEGGSGLHDSPPQRASPTQTAAAQQRGISAIILGARAALHRAGDAARGDADVAGGAGRSVAGALGADAAHARAVDLALLLASGTGRAGERVETAGKVVADVLGFTPSGGAPCATS